MTSRRPSEGIGLVRALHPERRTGRSIFDEFAEAIAGPSGMRDFDPAHQRYATGPWSQHRTYARSASPLVT